MKNRIMLPFLILLGAILVMGLVCGPFSINSAPTQTGGSTNAVTPTNAGGAVNNLQDVQKATIQIESNGTFVEPEGLKQNAGWMGSGFIIDPSGIAVTNNHVVTGAALIKVWVNGESTPRNAQILGVSECSDLAVIKINGSGFSYLDWNNQASTVGMEVYAAGFPLGEPQFNLTKGIISKNNADGRTNWASLDHVLATDAKLNPGNSGGPLVTANGQVVGIDYRSNNADQYFAIDATTAQPIVNQLKTGVDIDTIGINGSAFVSQDGSYSGIWISSVKAGSAADKAGMKAGDILEQMQGLVLAKDGTMKDYCDILRTYKQTDTLSVQVYRYSTGETFQGELNGRPITSVATIAAPTQTATPNLVATQDTHMAQVAQGVLTKLGLPVDTGNLYWVQDTQVPISLEGPGGKYYVMDQNFTASDFVISTEITWTTDSWPICGLWFRSDDNWEKGNYYQFAVLRYSGFPGWDIEYWKKGEYFNTVTEEVRTSSFLTSASGATNKIVLSAVGDEFKVYVNGNFEGRYYDYSKQLSSGKFAFYASEQAGNTKCSFDNTWVWLYK